MGRCAPRDVLEATAPQGGAVQWMNPWQAKLFQTCVCGAVQKKPLSERWRRGIPRGASGQRGLMSARLALHTGPEDVTLRAGPWALGAGVLPPLAHTEGISEVARAGLRTGTFGRAPWVKCQSQGGSANTVLGSLAPAPLPKPPQGGGKRSHNPLSLARGAVRAPPYGTGKRWGAPASIRAGHRCLAAPGRAFHVSPHAQRLLPPGQAGRYCRSQGGVRPMKPGE